MLQGVLHGYYRDVTDMVQWCYIDATCVIQGCCRGVTWVLERYYRDLSGLLGSLARNSVYLAATVLKNYCTGSLLKSVSAVGISEKQLFLESGSFHSDMLGATNFGDCIVNTMIFIKKYVVRLYRLSFYELFKIQIMTILAMLKKLDGVGPVDNRPSTN